MSSHREAPEISKDPVADSTDVYVFVSPDQPSMVTILANYIPLQAPDGGPNFFEFGDDVAYEIYICNDGTGIPNITYQFRFETQTLNPESFLYNTGPITDITSPNWNRPQTYSVSKFTKNGSGLPLASALSTPPCNIGPRSTPNYAAVAQQAVHQLPTGEVVFAGQRADEFYFDLGSGFDLLDLRPFQALHLIPSPPTAPVNGLNRFNVHTIAIQIPKSALTRDGSYPTDPMDPRSVIGVWTSASRRKSQIKGSSPDQDMATGPWTQVSRMANPLVNEVLIPLGKKDEWNRQQPADDAEYVKYYAHPEVSKLLPILYPGVFPHLAGLTAERLDIEAILLTGIPAGIIPGFQNFTGKTPADMLRLNMAIPPAATPSIYGVVGGDLAGFPNGRRVTDDIFTIELRALAGLTYPLINPAYKPDGAASLVTDGLTPANVDSPVLPNFPYLGVPYDGYTFLPTSIASLPAAPAATTTK